jgi:cellulose synthase operon protein C
VALSAYLLLSYLGASSPVLAANGSSAGATNGPVVTVERVSGPIPEEVAAYDDVLARFREHSRELVADIKSFVSVREGQVNSSITQNYGRTIAGLLDDEVALRALAKSKFENFLNRYPDAEYTPHVMFRLAELEYEEAEETWLKETDAYNQLVGQSTAEQLENPPPLPLKDYTKPLALYNRIIWSYPNYERIDGVWYMLGYCYSESNSAQRDEEKGKDALTTLIKKFPNSEFSNDANMRLGEYYFDNNQIPEAIEHYKQIVDAGEDARYFDKGLYKLAWSHYKLASKDAFGEYDLALKLFTQLLDYSRKLRSSTGEESSMEPEAIEYMAISFVDVADIQNSVPTNPRVSPMKVSEEYFKRVGERPYELDIDRRLADVLRRQVQNEEAIAAYTYLQQRWPLEPENPQFQNLISQLYMKLPVPDTEAAAQAKVALADRYKEGTAWATANRNNPDAVAIARGFIEQSLAKMATDLHLKAQQTSRLDDFSAAADRYREYLTRFPFADDYYEMEFYFADALFKSHRLPEAEKEYLQLLKTTTHPYGDGALYLLMQVRRQMLIDKYGKVEARPENALVERTVTSPFGGTVTVYMLDDDHKAFIDVADRIVAKPLKEKSFEESREKDLAALYYLPAQILFEYGHYDDARKRFLKIIDLFPDRDESAYSASLIIRTYQEEKDIQKVRLYSGLYARKQNLGKSKEAADVRLKFPTLEEGSAFQMASMLLAEGKLEAGAEAFLQFRTDFPKSEHVPDALFNAANNYEKIGKFDKANMLFEQFINLYPTDERSEGFYVRIATNYAQILDLSKAIGYYEKLVRIFPKSNNAPIALYNAAFLKIGMGDYRGAAEAFEAYATHYPDQPDAENSMYTAGEQWEKVGPNDALAFFKRYLRRYPSANQDHAMEVQYRVIQILEAQGKDRLVEAEWATLASMYDAFARAGTTSAMARRYAAEGEFRGINDAFEQFKSIKFSGNEEKDARVLVEGKPAEMKALQDRCLLLIQKYQDFNWSSAAIYIQAAAYFTYADMLFDAPPPKGFTDDQVDFYRQQLDDLRVPVEEKGKNRALAIIEKARNEHFWSEWQGKALDLLNARFPKDYPAEKVEERYSTHGVVLPDQGPVSIVIPGAQTQPVTQP